MRQPTVLHIRADVVRMAFDENDHELVIVKDIVAFQCAFGQLISVFLDA